MSNRRTTRQGTAAYLFENCPVNPTRRTEFAFPLVAVGAALAPLIANLAVTVGENLLNAEKEGLSGQFVAGTASEGVYTEEGKLSFGCLIIIRGLFGAPNPSGISGDEEWTTTHLDRLSLADYPAFYLEAEVKLVGTSLMLQPRYIRYAQSSALREGSGMKHVGVVVALTEAVLASDAEPTDEKAIALYRFNLGRLEIGKSCKHSDTEPLLTGTAAQQMVPSAGGQQGRVSFNVLAIVTETEQPGLLLDALSTAYGSKKGDLEKALTDIITDALPPSESE
jgi:hypothetical protein